MIKIAILSLITTSLMALEFKIVKESDTYLYQINDKSFTDVKVAIYTYKSLKDNSDTQSVDISANTIDATDHVIAIIQTFMSTHKPQPYYPSKITIAGKQMKLNGENGFLKLILKDFPNKALFVDDAPKDPSLFTPVK